MKIRIIKAPKLEIQNNLHAFGGDLLSNGVEWDNGVTVIGNGGTHELSPYEGVLMGVDPLGIPNLVEEGEVIWNDYVFSNRIPVPNAVRSKYKLRGTKNMTFADAAKKASKESEEMPNDNITLRGLLDIMSKLAYEQEAIREKRNMNSQERKKKNNNKYNIGGLISPYYDAPKDTMYNPLYNRSVYVGNDNTTSINFGAGITSLGEWVEEPKYMARAAAKRAGYDVGDSLEEYNKNPIIRKNKDDDLLDRDNLLRYAPVAGPTLGLILILRNKPNYSRADALALFAQNAGKITPISYDPLGDFLTYRPTDMNHIANRMAALAGATRRNIMNTSGGNRANAIGSLLAADYNSQIALADAIRLGEDTNWNRYMQAMTFNRGTKLYNSEAALKAAAANQEARMKASQLGLSGYTNAMQMKDAIDALRNASINANLTNLFDNLGQIGEEIYDKNRLKWMERKGVLRSDYFDTGKYRKKYGGHINKGGK